MIQAIAIGTARRVLGDNATVKCLTDSEVWDCIVESTEDGEHVPADVDEKRWHATVTDEAFYRWVESWIDFEKIRATQMANDTVEAMRTRLKEAKQS